MEYTGISKEKGEFVSRKSKEEFFRYGEAIKELYKWTEADIIRYSRLRESSVLDILNYAYQIAQAQLAQQPFVIKFRNTERKDYSYAVALVLLQLHQKFCPIDGEALINLKSEISYYVWRRFQTFAQNHELSQPIFFELQKETNFIQAKNDIVAVLDEAIKLKEENEQLRKQLEAERRLRNIAEQASREKQEKLGIWENDSFYKAVNINSIFEYAQSKKCSESNREAIRNTLLYLCSNKVSDEVIEKIKNLELGGKVYIGKQENHGCQQFYGNVTDSDFHA